MSIKSKNKRVGMGLMVVATCIVVAGLWAVLVTPETALAKKPGGGGGDTGVAPVCVEFSDLSDDGVQSDNETPYCNDKQSKIKAIMTHDGHVDLQPNTGRGDGRILKVSSNIYPDYLDGVYFFVGWANETFDMRAMEVGDVRNNVNLMIKTKTPDAPDGNHWWFIFDPTWDRWGIDYSESTYVTVTCTGEDETGVNEWVVTNTTNDEQGDPILSQAVRVIQTKVKNKSEFTYGGVVTVPPFTATVTLVP
jgi:hypothetical protein